MKFLLIGVISLRLISYLDAYTCESTCSGPNDSEFKAFIESLTGSTLSPDSSGYDKASLLNNRRVSKNPGLIVFALNVEDVKRTVRFAKQFSLKIAIQSTGHSYTGRSTTEGGVLLNMSKMKGITVNLSSTRSPHGEITVESGNTWGRVYKEVDKYDRVVVGGADASVGVTGYTLGGGHSPITRSHGLAVDNLLEATLVTAEGKIVTLSASGTKIQEDDGTFTENPDTDLFWAIRGGGGGTWGVVVTVTFVLHQPPNNGMLWAVATYPMYTIDSAPGVTVLKKYYEFCETLDDSWGGYAVYTDGPLNTTHFGILSLSMVHFGGYTVELQTQMEQFIANTGVTPVSASLQNKTSFLDYEKEFEPDLGGTRVYIYNSLLQNDTDYNGLVDLLAGQTPLGILQGCVETIIGGAMMKTSNDETSISPYFRTATHSLSCYLAWTNPQLDVNASMTALKFGNDLKKFGKAVYFNEPTQGITDWKKDTWGLAQYAKLLIIKQKWDPDNFFTCHHCVGSDVHTKDYCPLCVKVKVSSNGGSKPSKIGVVYVLIIFCYLFTI